MFKLLITVVGLLAFATSAQSELVNNIDGNLVTNGSFTDELKNGTTLFSGAPSGWTVAPNNGEPINSPDTMDQTANFGRPGTTDFAEAPNPTNPTPDGGTWVGLARDDNRVNSLGSPRAQNERIGQLVEGFILGAEYRISWYEGNFGFDIADPTFDFLNANAIEADLSGVHQFNGAFIPTDSEWVIRSFTFYATRNSYDLSFGLINPARSYLSIDGVSITAVEAVPEPSTYGMLIAGILLIGAFQRKRTS